MCRQHVYRNLIGADPLEAVVNWSFHSFPRADEDRHQTGCLRSGTNGKDFGLEVKAHLHLDEAILLETFIIVAAEGKERSSGNLDFSSVQEDLKRQYELHCPGSKTGFDVIKEYASQTPEMVDIALTCEIECDFSIEDVITESIFGTSPERGGVLTCPPKYCIAHEDSEERLRIEQLLESKLLHRVQRMAVAAVS